MTARLPRTAVGAALVLWLLLSFAARAQIDEIQVYTGEINKPGEFSITLHNNYTINGPKRPAFIGGIVPRSLAKRGTGIRVGGHPMVGTRCLLPALHRHPRRPDADRRWELRALFVLPNAAKQAFWYGVNFEFSYNARHWEEARYAAEVRPILGWRFGPVDLLLNPIIDVPFHGGPGELTLAPAERVAYNLPGIWALAVEHYGSYGRFANFQPFT